MLPLIWAREKATPCVRSLLPWSERVAALFPFGRRNAVPAILHLSWQMAGKPRNFRDGSRATLRWMKSLKRPGNGTPVDLTFLQLEYICRLTEVQGRVQQQTDYQQVGVVY